jgi:hypothetical protein
MNYRPFRRVRSDQFVAWRSKVCGGDLAGVFRKYSVADRFVRQS